METWQHLLFSVILAGLLFPIFKWKALIILIGGVAIDADHYFFYIYKTKNFNLAKCYRYFTAEALENDHKYIAGNFLIFHTIEFLSMAILLSFYNTYALIFAIGLIGHFVLDFIWFKFIYKRFVLNHSIIYWICKNKQKL